MPFDDEERKQIQARMNKDEQDVKEDPYFQEQREDFVRMLVLDGLSEEQVRLFLAEKGAYVNDHVQMAHCIKLGRLYERPLNFLNTPGDDEFINEEGIIDLSVEFARDNHNLRNTVQEFYRSTPGTRSAINVPGEFRNQLADYDRTFGMSEVIQPPKQKRNGTDAQLQIPGPQLNRKNSRVKHDPIIGTMIAI